MIIENEKALQEVNDVLKRIFTKTMVAGYHGSVELKWSVVDGKICNVVGDAKEQFRGSKP